MKAIWTRAVSYIVCPWDKNRSKAWREHTPAGRWHLWASARRWETTTAPPNPTPRRYPARWSSPTAIAFSD